MVEMSSSSVELHHCLVFCGTVKAIRPVADQAGWEPTTPRVVAAPPVDPAVESLGRVVPAAGAGGAVGGGARAAAGVARTRAAAGGLGLIARPGCAGPPRTP